MRNLFTISIILFFNFALFAQTSQVNSDIENWTSKSDLEEYIGQKVFLPPLTNSKNKSLSWFNHPFLFTLDFREKEISSDKNVQSVLRKQIKSGGSTSNYLPSVLQNKSNPDLVVFNYLYTNIYLPGYNSGSAGISNSSDVSNEYYTIIDVISESDMQAITSKWNEKIELEFEKANALTRKKNKWEKSSKTMVYHSRFADARMAIMLQSNETKDTVYFIDQYQYKKWQPTVLFMSKFVLVSYFERLQALYNDKVFVYNESSMIYDNVRVKQGSKWVCKEVSVSYSSNYITFVLEGVKGEKLIRNSMDGFISDDTFEKNELDRKQEEELAKQKLKEKREKETIERAEAKRKELEERRLKFIIEYGEKYGELVSINELEIGMSKEMCADAWGAPTKIKQLETGSGIYDIWNYLDIAKLYFINDKLSKIEREL